MKIFTSMKIVMAALFLAIGTTAMADEITFDASSDKSGNTTAGKQTIEKSGITLEVSNGILGTNDGQYRVYKNQTLTITSTVGNITGIEFTCTANNASQYGPGCFSVTDGTYSYDGKIGTWTGDAASATFTASANQVRITQLKVFIGGDTPGPQPTVDKIYEKELVNDEGGFTITDVTVPEGLSYVWKNGGYGWVASGYKDKALIAESWLVSPKFTIESDAKLSFEHALNKGSDEAIDVCVTEDFQTFVSLEVPNIPEGNSWNFIESGEIDLSNYSGKSIYIVFKYNSSDSNAPSWEIKNFLLKGKGTAEVVEPKPEVTYETISAIKAAATAEEVLVEFKLNSFLVTYISGSNIYITDGTEGFLLYGTTTAKVGDKIDGTVTGKLKLYHGLPELELKDVENLSVVSSDNDVAATDIEELGDIDTPEEAMAYTSMIVTIAGFNTGAESLTDRAVMINQNGDEVKVYDQFNVLTTTQFSTTREYTATFIVSVRDEAVQLYPLYKSEWEAPYEFVGDGTKENPYTVADVQHFDVSNNFKSDLVWVKGFIVGSAKSKIETYYPVTEGVEAQASNILIADAASETSTNKFVPVALAYNTSIRSSLNLVDNSDKLGKEVLLQGKIQAYFSIAGVKDLAEAIIDGQAVGINEVNAESVYTQGIFTLAGQRVNTITRGGMYIIGGKKVLVK